MKRGLFPGTFDPPTLGHLKMIERASQLCQELVVGIGANPTKDKSILSIKERTLFLQQQTQSLHNVTIDRFAELTVVFAKRIGADVLIRGLRNGSDLDAEKQMAEANRRLGIDTIFLLADQSIAQISSTLMRELAAWGVSLKDYLPENLEALLHKRLQEKM